MESDVLARLSHVLLKEQFIENQNDLTALQTALNKVKHPKSPTKKPIKFHETTLQRMQALENKKHSKLEERKKEKFLNEITALQEKPRISPNSKRYSGKTPPLYQRLEQVIKVKDEHIKSLRINSQKNQESPETKPLSARGKTRTPDQFIEQMYKWEKRRQEEKNRLLKEKEKQELEELSPKPTICPSSNKMAKRRSETPTFLRLYQVKKETEVQTPEQKPTINVASAKLAKKGRNRNVYERLYRSSKPQPRPVPKAKTPRPPRISCDSNFELPTDKLFMINTSRGPIYQENNPVNEVNFKPKLDFLMKSFRTIKAKKL